MRAFLKMTWIELKLFLREPVGTFFTLAFPLILLFLFGTIFGNEPSPQFGGHGNVDVSVPGYIALIIGTIAMIGLPIGLATYREQGILRRLRATPLRPLTVLGAQVAVNVVMAFIGIILLVAAAILVYDLQFPEFPLALIPAIILSGLGFFAVGFVIAGLMPTPRTAQAVGMALFFPMMFLSGAAMPRQILPEGLRQVSEYLPLTHVVTLIQDLWFGSGWNTVSLAVLVGLLIVGTFLANRTFRWE